MDNTTRVKVGLRTKEKAKARASFRPKKGFRQC